MKLDEIRRKLRRSDQKLLAGEDGVGANASSGPASSEVEIWISESPQRETVRVNVSLGADWAFDALKPALDRLGWDVFACELRKDSDVVGVVWGLKLDNGTFVVGRNVGLGTVEFDLEEPPEGKDALESHVHPVGLGATVAPPVGSGAACRPITWREGFEG